MSNRTGVGQLYGWDLMTGDLHQATDRPAGTVTGTISGDGRWILYVDDRKGDELGHWVRVPFEGGKPQDLTPNLPPYTSDDLVTDDDGVRAAFTAAMDDGFTVLGLSTGPDAGGEPRPLYRSRSLCSVEG
ncbi:MAG: S9 family peptidase, partial [Chloroflexi bacterium]|nr:S9 family peptidase [Chloroflexota bacterium]